jgi:hypothetical protein
VIALSCTAADRAALTAVKFWRFRPAMNYSSRPVMAAFAITLKAE